MKGIADTGFIVAFLNRRDRHHAWARQIALAVSTPLLTCEAVLAEAVWHLRVAIPVFGLIHTGLLRIGFTAADHLEHLEAFAIRYRDIQPDFADLCLVRMSELHRHHAVITTDERDFRIYRRQRDQIIPVHTPFSL